jgi:hypothetical protein
MKKPTRKQHSTNFLTHEALIVQGETLTVQGWVDVALEAKTFEVSCRIRKGICKELTQHSANTIRQYASFVIAGIKRYGSAEKLLKAYDESYSRIAQSRFAFVLGSIISAKSKRASRFSAKKVADKMKKQLHTQSNAKQLRLCL